MVRRSVSGRAEIVPGSPQSASCLIHQPFEFEFEFGFDDVDDAFDEEAASCSRRFKYDTRDSDAAAQRSGTAANPRGVNNTLEVAVLPLSLLVV